MADPASIDRMNGHEFEYYCAELLRRNGYNNVQVTRGSGDFGADIIAEHMSVTYAIQCKCHKSSIGYKAVQEALSGKSYYKTDKAVVLTNNYFTKQAIQGAQRLGVILWDRNVLLKLDKEAYLQNTAYNNVPANKRSSNLTPFVGTVIVGIVLVVIALSLLSSLGSSIRTSHSIGNSTKTPSVETVKKNGFDFSGEQQYSNGENEQRENQTLKLATTLSPDEMVTTLPKTTHEPLTDLKPGDDGILVKQMQQALVWHGYMSSQYVNGIYDTKTQMGVFAFQRDHRLTPTGKADIETLLLIFE